MRLLLAATLCFAGSVSLDAQPMDLLYSAHFDNYAAANWARGTRLPYGGVRSMKLIDGRFGKALSLPAGRSLSVVANDGNFRADQGTVQMWVRPNWHGGDGKVHEIFNARAKRKNYLNLNVLADGTLGVATGSAGQGSYRRVVHDITAWQAGQWHHLAFTWGDESLTLFVDGARVGQIDKAIPLAFNPPTFTIGRSLDGAVDELAVWSVALPTFDASRPIGAPDLGPPPLPNVGIPPVGEIDRYHYAVPRSPSGCFMSSKHYVEEIDSDGPAPESLDEQGLTAFAARDEWQSVGLVLHATRDLTDVTVTCSALSGPGNATIPAANLETFLIRRAMQRTAPRVPDDSRVPMPTLLDPAEPIDLPEGHFKEAVVTVHVPSDCVPGRYRGGVGVSADARQIASVPLAIEVLPFRLVGSERKQWGMYYLPDLSEEVREGLIADLRDMRRHGVEHLFLYVSIGWSDAGGQIAPSYAELDRCFSILRRVGFAGTVIINTGFERLLGLLVKEAGEDADEEKVLASDAFFDHAEKGLRGLQPIKDKYPALDVVVTHMDEVVPGGRRPRYIALTKAVRRVPEQRMYITIHTLPLEGVRGALDELDPWMDIRGYHGYSQTVWMRSGHTWDELAKEVTDAGDEMWMYYNPHRPFYTAEWSRVINGLFMWWSPVRVHCPYRYRTMRSLPLSFIHNMAYSVRSFKDLKTPIATRQWEGFRLGMQDCRYLCMLEDLIADADNTQTDCAPARAWLDELRNLMPDLEQIEPIDGPEANYPLAYTVSKMLNGDDYERIRRTTADHIIALRNALGVVD